MLPTGNAHANLYKTCKPDLIKDKWAADLHGLWKHLLGRSREQPLKDSGASDFKHHKNWLCSSVLTEQLLSKWKRSFPTSKVSGLRIHRFSLWILVSVAGSRVFCSMVGFTQEALWILPAVWEESQLALIIVIITENHGREKGKEFLIK